MPKRRKRQKTVQTWREQLEIAKAITMAYGGKIEKEVMKR